MKNELRDICSKLEGYNDDGFLVISAKKENGHWFLEVESAQKDEVQNDEGNK